MYKTGPTPILACTSPRDGRLGRLVAGGDAAVGFWAVAVCALLHPLHHQAQQRADRLVHLHARGSARFKVRYPGNPRGG